MSHFVMVHGAMHGAWCWDHVATGLRSRGHVTTSVDLPGSGSDLTDASDVTLASAAQKVADVIATADDEPVVLVGHSMGGAVITQVADLIPKRIQRLVYLAAFRPLENESTVDLNNTPEGEGDGVQAHLTFPSDRPVAVFDTAYAREVLYHDVDEELIEWAVPLIQPQPLRIMADPQTRLKYADGQGPAYRNDPLFIIAEADRSLPVPLQKLMGRRLPAEVVEIDSGHFPMLSRIDTVVDLLDSAASDVESVSHPVQRIGAETGH